jgi:hypothetical protein
MPDEADIGRLYAANVIVDPPVGGNTDVQSALAAGGSLVVDTPTPLAVTQNGAGGIAITDNGVGGIEIDAVGGGGVVLQDNSGNGAQLHVDGATYTSLDVNSGSGYKSGVRLAPTGSVNPGVTIGIAGAGDAMDLVGFYGSPPVAQAGVIADPAGGAVVDVEARAAIVAILDALGAAGGGIGITA